VPATGQLVVPQPTAGPIVPASVEEQMAGNAQWPAPMIYAATGDTVTIYFKNLGTTNPGAPNDPHSIHLHGLDVDVANDGVPETSAGAIPANLPGAPGAGNVIVYMFVPKYAGTSMYHCHQEADIHVQMGMYGALVVYNPNDPARLGGPGTGGGSLHGFKYDRDVVLMLSEVDLRQHYSEEVGALPAPPFSFNPSDYRPQYWMINGLSFPDSIHGSAGNNWADWNASHPGYDPLIAGSALTTANSTNSFWRTPGEKILVRFINMGYETQPMHIHGYHLKIIGSDQRAWPWANWVIFNRPIRFGEGLEKNTLLIGSGETYDALIDLGQQKPTSTYAAGTQTRYNASGLPTANTTTDPVIPDLGGVPYLGGPTIPTNGVGVQGGIVTPGQVFVFHNHDDYKATNFGVYPGGMFTAVIPTP
jgi:FtsP/CotA-like multicopper oxidase with cupredoxin domain